MWSGAIAGILRSVVGIGKVGGAKRSPMRYSIMGAKSKTELTNGM